MGDRRYRAAFRAFMSCPDRVSALRRLRDEEVLHALAGSADSDDPLVVNVLATEALNRERRARLARRRLSLALLAAVASTAVLLGGIILQTQGVLALVGALAALALATSSVVLSFAALRGPGDPSRLALEG